MGDFNSNTPALRGSEWRPQTRRLFTFDTPSKGLLLRHKPMNTANQDFYVQNVVGTPGYAIEHLNDSYVGVPLTTQYAPLTDTGKITTGWQNQSAGAVVNGDINDASTSTYAQNVNPLVATGNLAAALRLAFRLNQGSFAGRRILRVRVVMTARCDFDITIPQYGAYVLGTVDVGGFTFYSSPQLMGESVYFSTLFFDFPYSPFFQGPWDASEITALSTGTDEFGIAVLGVYGTTIPAGRFKVAELALEVTYLATDNRIRARYDTQLGLTQGPRWLERAFFTYPASNGAYNWLHIYNWLRASIADNWSIPIFRDPNVVEAVSSGAATGEHRKLYETSVGPGGVILAANPTGRGDQIPVLYEVGAVIGSQSMPYTQFYGNGNGSNGPGQASGFVVNSTSLQNAQEVTTAASTTYGAIRLAIGWGSPNQPPDQPLLIDLRHGAGHISAGGTLDATLTVQPSEVADGPVLRDMTVKFPVPLALLATTQYAFLFRSSATPGRGWSIAALYDGAIEISTGITAAELDGAGIGGTADSLAFFGTENDNWDIPLVLVQSPTAPTGLTATLIPEVCELLPQRVRLTWTATALGTAFGGVYVYRRPTRDPVADWVRIGFIDGARLGYTPAMVEANDRGFDDWTAAIAMTGGQYADGWDYTITVLNATTGIESDYATPLVGVKPVAALTTRWAATSNRKPFLNGFIPSVRAIGGGFQQRHTAFNFAGRDEQAVQGPVELAGREWDIQLDDFSTFGEDVYRRLLQAAALVEPLAFVGPMGQLIVGVPEALSDSQYQPANVNMPTKVSITETNRKDAPVADFNMACGLMLNGSTQYVTHADNALLDPLSADFTVFWYGVPGNSGASRMALAKIDNVGGRGYIIGSTAVANQFRFRAVGATSGAEAVETNATWFDGFAHLAIGTLTQTATGLLLYRDDVTTAVATASGVVGSVDNAVALTMGANNAGASNLMACAPGIAYGLYPRVLGEPERVALYRYLANYAGYRAPSGARLFVDLRDTRAWPGYGAQARDLSGNGLHGTITGTPGTRGVPWKLDDAEDF